MLDISVHWNILCQGYCIFPQSKLSFNFLPFPNKKTINILKEEIKHLFQNMTEAGKQTWSHVLIFTLNINENMSVYF